MHLLLVTEPEMKEAMLLVYFGRNYKCCRGNCSTKFNGDGAGLTGFLLTLTRSALVALNHQPTPL